MESKVYKERLGDRARDIIAYGLGLKKYNPSKNEACCPFHEDKTPSFKWNCKALNFKCFGCGKTLDIYGYYMEFEGMSFMEAVKEVSNMTGGLIELSQSRTRTEYKKPDIKTLELGKEAIDYMLTRKISEQTLKEWDVRQGKWSGKDCYVFQYFNEKRELIYVSYREIGKGGLKGGCEKDTEAILWGMNHIDISKPVVITEGQPDAMAVWEAGYKNVVSVPGGAKNFNWIDHCWDWIEKVGEFIIFGDNDEEGLAMVNELILRLGKYRTKAITHEYKDGNEVLYYQGKEKILELINNAINSTPLGLIDMANFPRTKLKNKVDIGIPTGIQQLDYEIEDLKPEQLSVLVGRNGEGKSTLINQILCNCIDNRIPTFLYSGEMSTDRLINWVYKQAIGNDKQYLVSVQTKYRAKYDVTDEAEYALQKWMEGLFYTFDKSQSEVRKNINDLFQVMSIAVKRKGCKLLIIDNLMSAIEESADSINADQSNFVQKCKDFAEAYKVHVMLVVHPNKIKTKEQDLDKTDISGSNNIANKADVIISIQRNYDKGEPYDGKIMLLKDREEGRMKEIKLIFNEHSKRLIEIDENGYPIKKDYRWKHFLSDYESFVEVQEEIPDWV